ncbi:MAG: hypothetical protein PGN11_07215 [Quadrisphaera sp.]
MTSEIPDPHQRGASPTGRPSHPVPPPPVPHGDAGARAPLPPPPYLVLAQPVEAQAVVSLVLGSVSLLTSWIMGVSLLALAGAVAAITTGVVALRRLRTGQKSGAGLAVTGLCLAGFASVVAGFMSFFTVLLVVVGGTER